MPTITVSEETAAFIKNFTDQIKKQDNQATRSPYYYSVRTVKELPAPEGCGDGDTKYYHNGLTESYTEEELKEYCADNDLDFYDEVEDCTIYSSQDVTEYENVFFTEEGYKKHIELNGHNYRGSKEPVQFYVNYCYRNPEIEGLFKAINEISEAL